MNLTDLKPCFFRHPGILQNNLTHTDDGIHGGTDFMTHIGKEVTLGPVRFLRHCLTLLQHAKGLSLLGNVSKNINGIQQGIKLVLHLGNIHLALMTGMHGNHQFIILRLKEIVQIMPQKFVFLTHKIFGCNIIIKHYLSTVVRNDNRKLYILKHIFGHIHLGKTKYLIILGNPE